MSVKRKRHTYTNLILVFVGALFAYWLLRYEPFHEFLLMLGNYGYIGAFFAGMLFVSTFTAAIGALILFVLAENLMPLTLGLIAGIGATVGDLVIFRFVRDGLLSEIEDIYNRLGGRRLSHIIHVKAFRWMFPVIGAIIIASPLPDEFGVGLMGISKMRAGKFAVLSYILNSMGILAVVLASYVIKP